MQGATAGALLLADLALPEVQEQLGECAPRFAILIAGFLPRDAVYADHLQKAPLNTPTLFVWGTQVLLWSGLGSAEAQLWLFMMPLLDQGVDLLLAGHTCDARAFRRAPSMFYKRSGGMS
jgi:hypothetical protein